MLNALMCVHGCGDVIDLALAPLIRSEAVSRVLIADGPSGCAHKAALLVESPTVAEVADRYAGGKVVYQYTDYHSHRATKCNEILDAVSEDCTWVLVVDGDEVWRVGDLDRLIELAEAGGYDRYRTRFWNPYPDFAHHFELPQESGRLYRWFPAARCPDVDRLHQYVLSRKQTETDPAHHWGCALLPNVRPYHLNALRAVKQGHPQDQRRFVDHGDGTVTWRGGKEEHHVPIKALPAERVPEVIREQLDLGRETL